MKTCNGTTPWHAAGLTAPSAAIDLLIAHRTWLRRRDFLDQFTFTFTYSDCDTGTATTGAGWTEAVAALDHGRLACSSGGVQILRIAASLARGHPRRPARRHDQPGRDQHRARDPSHPPERLDTDANRDAPAQP